MTQEEREFINSLPLDGDQKIYLLDCWSRNSAAAYSLPITGWRWVGSVVLALCLLLFPKTEVVTIAWITAGVLCSVSTFFRLMCLYDVYTSPPRREDEISWLPATELHSLIIDRLLLEGLLPTKVWWWLIENTLALVCIGALWMSACYAAAIAFAVASITSGVSRLIMPRTIRRQLAVATAIYRSYQEEGTTHRHPAPIRQIIPEVSPEDINRNHPRRVIS